MNTEQRNEIMKTSDTLSKQLASVGDDDEFRHFVSYFLEALEAAHIPADKDGAMEITFEILEERLVNGRW